MGPVTASQQSKPFAVLLTIAILAGLVIAYQVRISLDTYRAALRLDYYVHFTLHRFTNRIATPEYLRFAEDRVNRPRVEPQGPSYVLAVNGDPLRGASQPLRAMRPKQDSERAATSSDPGLSITVFSKDRGTRTVYPGTPHCTCGVMDPWDIAVTLLAPPAFCIALGFLVLWRHPRSLSAWAFLGLQLSLSKIPIWPEVYAGFVLTATPMAWDDAWRVPAVAYRAFVQHIWPAAVLVLLLGSWRTRSRGRIAARGLAAALCAWAVLESAFAVSWSEDYRIMESAYHLLREYQTECLILVIVTVTIVGWLVRPSLGFVLLLIGLSAAAALYRNPDPIEELTWMDTNGIPHIMPLSPRLHHKPHLVMLLYAFACICSVITVFRKHVRRSEMVALGLLALPLLHIAAVAGGYLYPLAPVFFARWPWFLLALSGAALRLLAHAICRRIAPTSAHP
ncbi:MAG: hypothetical protein JNL98_27750 [Bryobacterales bacterium]|nr:hypothetical protein [Bryobacterales bacterium]